MTGPGRVLPGRFCDRFLRSRESGGIQTDGTVARSVYGGIPVVAGAAWPIRTSWLTKPEMRFFQVPAEREQMVVRSFPEDGDYDGLRQMITASVEGDLMGVGARGDGDTVRFAYPSVVLVSVKPEGPSAE